MLQFWNLMLFHEFECGAQCEMVASWPHTQSADAKTLIAKCRRWIDEAVCVGREKRRYLGMGDERGDGDGERQIVHSGKERLFLVNGQVTPVFECAYFAWALATGLEGLGCDVAQVNAEMLKCVSLRELFKVNVWDMDFVHPLLVQKIIDANLKYIHPDCGPSRLSPFAT